MNVMAYRLLLLKLWLLKQVMASSKVLITLAVKLSIRVFMMNQRAEKQRDDLSE